MRRGRGARARWSGERPALRAARGAGGRVRAVLRSGRGREPAPGAAAEAPMNDQRPDPDELLRRLHEQEERERRAKLKIFFGASAGVGKTYAMLVEAHERRRAGVDVAIGVAETHGRAETAALLEGLEQLPPRAIEYRGATLQEFD